MLKICKISRQVILRQCYPLKSFSNFNQSKIVKITQTINQKEESYLVKQDSNVLTKLPSSNNVRFSLNIQNSITKLSSLLLPKGYPSSVHSGYYRFVKYQIISSIFSSAGGILSMHSLLLSVGLSSTSGSLLPLSAILNWILKDGLGQFGGIAFASLINIQFDASPKKWRFISSLLLEFSNFIEMLTFYFPMFFLPLASLANIGKNISFLSSSATRSVIHKSFVKDDNLADITVRTGSQNIFASILGTTIGISLLTAFDKITSLKEASCLSSSSSHSSSDDSDISSYISEIIDHHLFPFGYDSFFSSSASSYFSSIDPSTLSLSGFAVLSMSSLLCTYKSLSFVTINILTFDRLEMLIHHYFHLKIFVFSPQEMELNENLFGSYDWSKYDRNILKYLPNVYIGKELNECFVSSSDFKVNRSMILCFCLIYSCCFL
jgi:hypothetical protein